MSILTLLKPAVVLPAQPTPIEKANDDQEKVLAYREKCIAVGAPIPLDVKRMLQRAILEKIVPIYDTASVYRYMDALIQKERQAKLDNRIKWYWTHYIGSDFGLRWQVSVSPCRDQDGNELVEKRISGMYTRLVPEYIIDRCALVKETFAEEFKKGTMSLLITDYGVPDPDPFLGLYSTRSEVLYVIGVWDEPGFQ